MFTARADDEQADQPGDLSRLVPGGDPGFAPAPGDYLRRVLLGHLSVTAAARQYLAATTAGPTEADVNALAARWLTEVTRQREALLGDRLDQYRRRVDELIHSPMSTAAAEAMAFTELVPDAAGATGPAATPTEAPEPAAAAPEPAVVRFRPATQADLAPSGEVARIRANLAALRTLRTIQADHRPATAEEQAVLGRWSGWGAVPAALDPVNDKYTWVRDELAQLLDERELAAARRTVINAHYTDAALVQAIWDGVHQLGFAGGRVLEPGCGAGNFIAFAPDSADITGVELDPTTAAIAAALHPQAQILAESFADTRTREGAFDAVVGNVPFGDVRLHDKRDNRGNHAIHNHFILKSLRLTRPGGLVAVITSAYTMDAANPAARREMQQMADLVGAVRLPSRAHARAAGTDALTDVLIFRRREDDREPAPFDWEYTAPIDVDGVALRVNAHFVENPQRVLGRFAVGDGLYRHDEVSVVGDPAAAPAALREALAQIAAEGRPADLTMTPASRQPVAARPAALVPRTHKQPDGYLRANADGTFSRQDDGVFEDYAPPKTQAAELRALLGLRDTAVALLEAEAASLDDTDEIDRLRERLNTRYDVYAATYGPINRFTDVPRRRRDKQTGKMVPALDEETGEPLMRRQRPPQGRFRHDPFSPVVRALEQFDEETQTATKADIFTQRVVAPRPPRLGADTPADALAICVDDHGEVRLPAIAWLLGVDEAAARQQLGTLVYDDPETGRLEPAAAYLSGDVKTKLAIARAAADEDDRYAVNVAALTEVVPRDLGPEEIVIKMGAPWIDAAYVQQFLAEILEDPTIVVEHGGGAMWTVHSDNNRTVAATSTWGTERRSAAEIAQHILEQREFVIKDTVSRNPKREVVNLDAIMAATEKAVEMRERFADWVWEDPERAATLVAKYNDTFQRYVPRSYDDVQLSLPGLAMAFKPDQHQIAAVARIINEPGVGLYHCVGAGKTASMIMGAMELRRLGLARKPVVVVPNQLLDQWTREFLRLYPQAKLLAASTEDLEKDQRRLMVARMATGDWDAVILTESAFEMLPMTPDAEQAYIDKQMAELEERISEARANGAELTLKRLETKKANREQRLEERLDSDKDAGIWWELTGIDYIFRDESHRDKNLRTVSNVSGMSIKGSQRAQQMDMKLEWLRERQPRWGTRATGTPIANSIVELFTEFRYLRPDLMEQQGITDVDAWLATYAEGKVVIEVTPDGGGLRNKTRLEFVNLDELITAMHVFADVKTKDDLNLERPALAVRVDGQCLPEMVVVQPSDGLLGKVAELVERAAKLKGKRPEKGGDNILKIGGEGAAAALDLRLVGLSTDDPQKLDVAADRIAGYYHANKDRIYLGHDGQPHPVPGSLQMAFCDLGTPSDKDPDRWTSYGELRTKLVARGVPREKIRFIHEATDDRQRAELFAACRDGRVAVLVASTEKGGTGVNVQNRLLALHELDCPWRPCDLEQREGRIDRRGNQNDEIRIERYVTERSLDAFKWQKVAYKARQADLVMTGKAGRRTEDVGDVTLSYEEMKAAATGNPLLVDHAKAKTELARLERLERGYHRNQAQLRWTINNSRQEIGIDRALIAEADAAIARRTNTRGDAFAITVRGQTYTKRGEANDRLKTALGLVMADPRNLNGPAVEVGEFGGFIITAKLDKLAMGSARHYTIRNGLRVQLLDAPGSELLLVDEDLKKGDIVTRLENRLAKLEAARAGAAADIDRREAEIARAEQDLAKPFRHQEALAETRARFQQLDIQVIALAAASEAEANAATGDDDEANEADDEQGEPPHAPAPAGGPGPAAAPAPGGPAGGRGAPPGQPRQTPTPVRAAGHSDHQPGAAPDVSDVPEPALAGPGLDTLPATFAPFHDTITALVDNACADKTLTQAARVNQMDNFRLVSDRWVEEQVIDFATAADDDDHAATAFVKAHFNGPGSDDPLNAYVAAHVWARAHALPDAVEGPVPGLRRPTEEQPPRDQHEQPGVTSAEPTSPAPASREDAAAADGQAVRVEPELASPPRSVPDAADWQEEPDAADDRGVPAETQRHRRGHDFYPPPDIVDQVPRLYGTERQPDAEKVLYLHYFAGGSDWWLAEYDPNTGIGFGYACSNNDADNAEWGYVHLPELETVRAANGLVIVERDLYWTPKPAGEAELPGHRTPRAAADQATPDIAATQPVLSAAEQAPERTPAAADAGSDVSSSGAVRATLDPRHPAELVACTCCRPAGRDAPANTTEDAGNPPRHGRFAYDGRTPVGIVAGKRWLKVVTFADGVPASALAFVDPSTDEWYASASWSSPNRKHRISREDREWLATRLPYLAPAADAAPAAPAASVPAVTTTSVEHRQSSPTEAGDASPAGAAEADHKPALPPDNDEATADTIPETTSVPDAGLPMGMMVRYHGRRTDQHGAYLVVGQEEGHYVLSDRDYPEFILPRVNPASVTPTGEQAELCECKHEYTHVRDAEPERCAVGGCHCELHAPSRAWLHGLTSNAPAPDADPTSPENTTDKRPTDTRESAGAGGEPTADAASQAEAERREPQVHTFDTTAEAYDASQVCDDIRNGDVLFVPDEGVVGVLNQAWPVALTNSHGVFHRLVDEAAQQEFEREYQRSVAVAAGLIEQIAGNAGPVPRQRPAGLSSLAVGEEVAAADGQHVVYRRVNSGARTVYVDARHPQLGLLPRGRISLINLMPRRDADGTAPHWQIYDYDSNPVGEHTGDYLDAEVLLLAATSALDEPLPEKEAAELADDASDDTSREAAPGCGMGNPAVATGLAVTADTAEAAMNADTAAAGGPEAQHAAADGNADSTIGASTTGQGTGGSASTTPSWTSRIRVEEKGPKGLVVIGTTGAPREEGLRGLLKQHRFQYRGGQWRHYGRHQDRPAAIADIQRWLAGQDRADAQTVKTPAKQLPPTPQQQLIIDAYLAGKTVAVQALAGTGKTSTLQMLAAANPEARIAYIAFNRSIADEAQAKFPRNVTADTSHSFAREGLRATELRDKIAHVGKGARWPEEWADILGVRDVVHGGEMIEAEAQARTVMTTVKAFRESAAATVGQQHLPGSLLEPDMAALAASVLEHARRAWADITDPQGKLLFDHDDYIKIWALGNPRMPYDVIFFDEAQDINDVLRKVIQDQPTQTIVVGDSNQSIYGFRGAIDALNRWPADVTLPLTQSWRFGSAIADAGNEFLRLLRSPYLLTGNPGMASSIGTVERPDAVLARTNAGAVAAVFDAFDEGLKVALVGGGKTIRDIATAAQDLQNGRPTKHPELARFPDWEAVQDYVENDEHAQSLRAFVRLIDRRGADKLIQMADELVREDASKPDGSPAYDRIVTTAHKSKGREWPAVRIADDFPQPKENQVTGKVQLPDAEELRLAYVAVTRARETLELGSLSWIRDYPLDPSAAPAATRAALPALPKPEPVAAATALSTSQQGEPVVTPAPAQDTAQVPVAADTEPTPAGPDGADSQAMLFDPDGAPAAAEAPTVPPGATIYCPQRGCGRQAKVKQDGTIGSHKMYGAQTCHLVGQPVPAGVRIARKPGETDAGPVDDPAQSRGGPVDGDDPATAGKSGELRLAEKVAARVPKDAVLWTSNGDGYPAVLLAFVANGTYGRMTGVDRDRKPITATGYVLEARPLAGGIGGWSRDPVMVVTLGDLPDGPVVHTVQTDMDGRITVVGRPSDDMPAGEGAPWLRMPVEEQIVAARSVLGLSVEVIDGPHNELWKVEGRLEKLTGEVARWLFGGRYGSWEGRARPVFRTELVDEAIAAGRIKSNDEPQPPASARDLPADKIAVTTTDSPADSDIEGRIARLRPFTVEGPQYHRAVAEALRYAQMKMQTGGNPTEDLLEGEVAAGLRPREDLAQWRSNQARATAVPEAPAGENNQGGAPGRAAPTAALDGANAASEESDLTVMQRHAAAYLAQAASEHSTPGTRMSAYEQLPVDEFAALPKTLRDGLVADLEHILTTATPRERSAVRRLLDYWSGADAELSNAQRDALADVRAGSFGDDQRRVACYGKLSLAEYMALDPVHQEAITADLQDIAAHGATKTIPRNRTSMGTTIRGVTADHVHAAEKILRAISAGAKPYVSNEPRVGKAVSAINLNPGDRLLYRSQEVTVDRVGLDGVTYLTDGRPLPTTSIKYGMVAAGAEPVPAASAEAGQPVVADQQPRAKAGPAPARVGGDIPAHSPYQAGDRVRMHGFAPATSELGRSGFVGVVQGCLGATILTGVTDDGREWAEPWGSLVPEGSPNNSAASCTCCQRPAPTATDQAAAGPPAIASTDLDPDPVAEFSPADLAAIRNAVADHAAGYYGDSLGLGRDDAARYTAEGHLAELVEGHRLSNVCKGVAAVIDADLDVLTRSAAQRAQDRQDREARAQARSDEALAAFKRGDYGQALELIDRAELIDPTYRPGKAHGASWEDLRQIVTARRDQSTSSTPSTPAPDVVYGRAPVDGAMVVPGGGDAVTPAPPSDQATVRPVSAARLTSQDTAVTATALAGPDGGRSATAAQLARLDTAPGAHTGPTPSTGPRGAHTSTSTTTGRRAGPSV